MDGKALEELEAKALALLQKAAKGTNLDLFRKEFAQAPSNGETLFLFGAVDSKKLDAPQTQVVVNEKGEAVDLRSSSSP